MVEKSKIRYQNRPEVAEQFADSIRGLTFDGQTVRIELCVERQDSHSLAAQSCSSPSCRLVLSPDAAIELHDKLSGIIKRELVPLTRNAGR